MHVNPPLIGSRDCGDDNQKLSPSRCKNVRPLSTVVDPMIGVAYLENYYYFFMQPTRLFAESFITHRELGLN